jgi:hypothetical protein
MRYSVWSRGRLIGETDLGFVRFDDLSRFGWFHPNPQGERLMPVVASVLPAMQAYLGRDVDAPGDPIVRPAPRGSTLYADLAEAFQHLHSLDLELRREDGSVVPTLGIGIQDTHQLLELAALELAKWDEDDLDAANWGSDDDLFETTESELQLDADAMLDTEATDQTLGALSNDPTEWTPDTEWRPEDLPDPRFPRYQIHVQLLRGDEIP